MDDAAVAVASANCRCSRMVYVGNIAFNATEEEARDACELIGAVLSMRLATDAATGKRKGYAFVEYADDATAQSACRNLQGHLLRGRPLRVGLADSDRARRRKTENEPVGLEDAIHAASLVSGRPPAASITRLLATASRHHLRETMSTFESMGAEACRALKEQVPGLAEAMEQVQHLLAMAAADDAAEEARRKKRAASAAEESDDQRAKLRKVEDGGKAAARPILPCF
ncbi:cleavage stimulating factor 64-like [Lolium rigidum]|uniref:cleavage stimulating factor 64-like n=1 Tax=Lolium rigidum TaxID=89674 RepID=UPI001F5C83CC|nr:cleavage stimulating factor 64-like [Lolium rigidum]